MLVVEERELARNGLVASLVEDNEFRVIAADRDASLADEADIAVVSSKLASAMRFRCPVVVCGDDHEPITAFAGFGDVAGVVHSHTVTAAQLRAIVHAAAAGLKIETVADGTAMVLDPRERRVLQLMADGYSTREIGAEMSYSERTIKKLITAIESRLGARTRAHTIALAMRQGLI